MYRPKTTLEQWRILQAVVDHGGYAKAADYLNKSQSSLNHAVTKLQNLLDVQLLEVKGRKAFLTPAGELCDGRSGASELRASSQPQPRIVPCLVHFS